MASTELAHMTKNAKERIVFSRSSFNGQDLIDVRVYFEADSGEWLPTRKGIAMRPELFDEFAETVRRVEGSRGTGGNG